VDATVTRIPPPNGDDEAAIATWIAEVRRTSGAGELLEEIPWTDGDEVISNEVWAELNVRWALDEECVAAARRRRERRRRRAWRTLLTDA
jgi:hypothetical protein